MSDGDDRPERCSLCGGLLARAGAETYDTGLERYMEEGGDQP